MNEKLSKEIMERTQLTNKFWNASRKTHNKQRKYVVSLLRNKAEKSRTWKLWFIRTWIIIIIIIIIITIIIKTRT